MYTYKLKLIIKLYLLITEVNYHTKYFMLWQYSYIKNCIVRNVEVDWETY